MKSRWIFKTKGQKPLIKTKGVKMFVSDSLDYQLDYQLDQMRWEYERAMWELAQNQKQDKEQVRELNNNEKRDNNE